LKEDAIDLFEVNLFGLIPDGFQEAGEAEIADSADNAFGGTDDESQRLFGEGVVAEACAIELAQDEFGSLIGIESGEDDGVGDSGFDVLVDGEIDVDEKIGLADEDEVVIFWEVFKEKSEFAQGFDFHQMSVINDGDDHFAELIEVEGFFDEAFFAFEGAALEADGKCLTKDSQDVEIGVESAADGGGDKALGVMVFEGLFDGGFSGAGFTQEEAESSLLAVDAEGFEDVLLVGQESEGFRGEGIACETEIRADHEICFLISE